MYKKLLEATIKTKAEFNKQWPGYRFLLPGSAVLFIAGIYLDFKFDGVLSLAGYFFGAIGFFGSPIGLIVYLFYYFLIEFISNLHRKY